MADISSSRYDERQVKILVDHVALEGDLSLPEDSEGIVVFAHGSGSSRHSARNRYVAQILQKSGLATLLFDLLTKEEEEIDIYTREYRFNIEMLANRLIRVTQWLKNNPQTNRMNIGYFGASTGAGAALIAAANSPQFVQAVVSRGGRPDLAIPLLKNVQAPTLLIVGGFDHPVIKMNEDALKQIPDTTIKKLIIVQGATHLFEESGKLEIVAQHASEWFTRYLTKVGERV